MRFEPDDATALANFEALAFSQQPASQPWEPVTDYSLEARWKIEGRHPELIRDVFQPRSVLDAGCGPTAILVRLLRALGVRAYGIDVQTSDTSHTAVLDLARPIPGTFEWDYDLVICREVLEHLTIRQIRQAVTNLCALSSRYVYVTTRFHAAPAHLLDVQTSDDLDPTHISLLNQDFLRLLFVLEGFTRRADLEQRMDWQAKGRVLVYERA